MMRILVTAMAVIAMLAVTMPAEARQCKRTCSGGECWYNCSKIPGQNKIFGF